MQQQTLIVQSSKWKVQSHLIHVPCRVT